MSGERVVYIKALDHTTVFRAESLDDARGLDYLEVVGFLIDEDDNYYYLAQCIKKADLPRSIARGSEVNEYTIFKVVKAAVIEVRELSDPQIK